MLGRCGQPLSAAHDLVIFDLDGVVYVGDQAVGGVAERIARLRARGSHVAFITNNASRTPEQVAAKLTRLGVQASGGDVVTAAQAAARLLARRHGRGAKVMLLGGDGLRGALAEHGIVAVDDAAGAVALVSGYGPDVRWRDIMRAATAVRAGLPYVASNGDLTIPTPQGLAPGHGVLVRTIADFAGVTPTIAGKPERPLMEETVLRVGGAKPLMVGDRLDTDIQGASGVAMPSLLVLTGVTWLEELVTAPPAMRPTYISSDTSGIFEAHDAPRVEGGAARLGGWQAHVEGGRLSVAGEGEIDDWWRVAVTAAWSHLDATGRPVDATHALPPGPSRPHLSE